MSVAALLVTVADAAPCQRVRNYYLSDGEASPQSQDFVTAMKRTDGDLCVRWVGASGERIVRYDGDWMCAERERPDEKWTVAFTSSDRVRTWLRGADPDLLTYEDARDAFESEPAATHGRSEATRLTDGGEPEGIEGESRRTASDGGERSVASRTAPNRRFGDGERGERDRPDSIPVRREDLLADPALAAAFGAADAADRVFRLPLELAAETVLEAVEGSERVFVAAPVPERETDRAYYVRQGRASERLPKTETATYEAEDDALDFGDEGPNVGGESP